MVLKADSNKEKNSKYQELTTKALGRAKQEINSYRKTEKYFDEEKKFPKRTAVLKNKEEESRQWNKEN